MEIGVPGDLGFAVPGDEGTLIGRPQRICVKQLRSVWAERDPKSTAARPRRRGHHSAFVASLAVHLHAKVPSAFASATHISTRSLHSSDGPTHILISHIIRIPPTISPHVNPHAGIVSRADSVGLSHHAIPLLLEHLLASSGTASNGHPSSTPPASPMAVGDKGRAADHQEEYLCLECCFHLSHGVRQVRDGLLEATLSSRRMCSCWHDECRP